MGRKLLTTDAALESWRATVKDGSPTTDDVVVFKQFNIDSPVAEEGSRRIQFVASTDAVDRTNDVINQGGWRLDNFMRNPVSLFAHDHNQLPVGRVVTLSPEANRLMATIEFATAEDGNPFAEQVYRMVKSGFLRAVSVGFRPLKVVFNEERGGIDYEEQELLELSVVPVPAHQDALVAASRTGDLEVLRTWATEVLARLEADVSAEVDESDTDSPAPLTIDAVRSLARVPIEGDDADATLYQHTGRALPWDDGEPIDVRVAWKAYARSLTRKAKQGEVTDTELADLLWDHGFEELADVLRDTDQIATLTRAVDHLQECMSQHVARISELETDVKAGRVLSKANESKLQQSATLIGEVLSAVRQEVDDAEEHAGPENTDDKAAPSWDDAFEIEIEGFDPDEVEIDEAMLAAELHSASRDALAGVVREAVAAAVRSATGRID